MDLKQRILNQAQIALDSKNAFQLFLPEPIAVVNNGFKFIIHYYDSTALKILSNAPKRSNPLLPPFDTDLHVCDLGNGARHHLIINKFMQCKGHIVLSSMEENEIQGSELDYSDFCAFEQVFQSFDYEGMLYYNSGQQSGCSQPHKHTQYTPVDEFPILDAMLESKKLPFYYHTKKITDQITSEKMMEAYKELIEMAKNDPPHDSYNFIISKGNAFYIPRKKAQYKCGTLLNSFSMTGNIPVGEWSDESLSKDPMSAFEYVCFPISM